MRHNIFIFLALLLLLTGCVNLAPDYVRPEAPVPAAWTEPSAGSGQAAGEIPWQEYFVDPQLRQVISQALENNRDLRVALLSIERAQAQYQIQRAELVPQIDASGAESTRRIAADFSGNGQPDTVRQYNVGLGVSSYELDLFGRVRSLKERALEQYLATGEARRGVQLSLVAQVAGSYLNLAADRERLQLARETLANQLAAYQLVDSRFNAGVASALDRQQARTSLEAARVDIARYSTMAEQEQNLLNLLCGAPVPENLLPGKLTDTLTAQKLAPGLPSEVLLSRPDILQSEHELRGANANIGAARAAFFPRIALVSSIGYASADLAGLFQSDSLAWNFAPQISLPIFDGGSRRAGLQVAEVDHKIAVAQYEKAIQSAFREVADALAQRRTINEQLAAQQALADAVAESYRLSRARYEKGVDSYLNVLDSQRSLYSAQQNLIGARLLRDSNLVTLYKVLGGGGA